jgi:nucleoside-diphosphate-sugar epimerase
VWSVVDRVLIAGCGYVGSALAERLAREGHEVWGLRRHTVGLPSGVVPIEADLSVESDLKSLPAGLTDVLYMASPGGSDDAHYRTAYVQGLRNLLSALESQGQRPRRVFFVSSTAVYAQSKGEWVDENSPTEPTHFSGRRLLESEELLRQSPFASCIVRFGGIYGPRRTRLIEQVRTGRAEVFRGPPRYTNRIHRDDCAGVLRHLMGLESPLPLVLGVDDEPAALKDVLRWLAGVLGAPPAREVRAGARDREGRRASNKRCSNELLHASGYTFEYPTYREGYTAILSESS